jgi:hypothetical protein
VHALTAAIVAVRPHAAGICFIVLKMSRCIIAASSMCPHFAVAGGATFKAVLVQPIQGVFQANPSPPFLDKDLTINRQEDFIIGHFPNMRRH